MALSKYFKLSLVVLSGACAGSTFGQSTQPSSSAIVDIVIYGCSPAGITAAVEARSQHKTVQLICRDQHVGGMTTNGLGWADAGDHGAIGGLARQFYRDVRTFYAQHGNPDLAGQGQGHGQSDDPKAMYVFEPHVAEQIYENWLKRAGVVAVRSTPIMRNGRGVTKRGHHILAMHASDGRIFRGRTFIDASYEGDLMAEAGVGFAVGREANAVFGETLNGVQAQNATGHQFDRPVDPYVVPGNPASGVLPRIELGPLKKDGTGDGRIQAYTYRLCMTKVPANRTPFPKPSTYDAREYELLGRYLDAGWRDDFRKFDPIPNGKTDTNNYGAFSMDNIGKNYAYPEGSDEVRISVANEHTAYQQGLLWFLQNDPRTPKDVRASMKPWGLCKDEFTDNGNWPREMYIREGRRMMSDFVMTERHIRGLLPTERSIGLGSYSMDSHHVQRYVDQDGHAKNEGNVQVNPRRSYEISYGAIIPRRTEVDNLLVPVALSASHIAYGSIRMEPVFMILGQSAASAAIIAINDNQAVQDISYEKLQNVLKSKGQVLEADDGIFATARLALSRHKRASMGIAIVGVLIALAAFAVLRRDKRRRKEA